MSVVFSESSLYMRAFVWNSESESRRRTSFLAFCRSGDRGSAFGKLWRTSVHRVALRKKLSNDPREIWRRQIRAGITQKFINTWFDVRRTVIRQLFSFAPGSAPHHAWICTFMFSFRIIFYFCRSPILTNHRFICFHLHTRHEHSHR